MPECIINYMKLSQVLCCERAGISNEEINILLSLEPFDESVNNNWYDSLTLEAKQIIDEYLEPHIEKKFPGKKAIQLKDEWVIAELRAALCSQAMDINIREIFRTEKKPVYPLDRTIKKDDWVTLREYTAQRFEIDNSHQFSNVICNEIKTDVAQNQYMTLPIEEQLSNLDVMNLMVPTKLCEERHVEWKIKLNKVKKNHQNLFVAVGCSHLVGETGLLQWLQESGYALENLKGKGEFEPFRYNLGSNECSIQ